VGTAGRDAVHPVAAGPRVGVQDRDDHAGVGLVGGLLGAADQLHRPRALDFGEDQVDESDRPVPLPGAPLVAVLVQQTLDALPGLGATSGLPLMTLETVGIE